MYQSRVGLFSKKFLELPKTVLDSVNVLNPLSIPYDMENDGKSVEEFSRKYDKFDSFRNEYYKLVDQLSSLASEMNLQEDKQTRLNENLDTFKENLFHPAYCDARPNVPWNFVREHLEVLVVLLSQSTLSQEKRLQVLTNLSDNLTVCADGVVSHLQGAIQTLVGNDENSDIILRNKEILVEQLVVHFVQSKGICRSSEGMEVHYVNAFINRFANALGLNQRPYERMVATDHPLIVRHEEACRQTITEKLPIVLVDYLADELHSAGQKALQNGQLVGETYQHFLASPIAKFFSGKIRHALFLEGEVGYYNVPKDSFSLHYVVAQHLMAQGWLQKQEAECLLTGLNGDVMYILANHWFYCQRGDDNNAQRPLVNEELFLLGKSCQKVTKDKKRAVLLFQQAAKQGYAKAQYKLGYMYLKGQGIYKDELQAVRCFKLSAEQGNAKAQYKLGYMYLKGQGIYKDELQAFIYFKLSAEQGNVLAQYELGYMYLNGQGIYKDELQAFRCFELSAEQGNVLAQYELGCMYLNGQGIDKDKKEARRCFKLSAEQGNAEAQYELGKLLLFSEIVRENPVQQGFQKTLDRKEAYKYFKLSADQGHTEAQYSLGCMFLNGQVTHVRMSVNEDKKEELRLFKLSAKQGHAGAQYNLGCMYLKGQGVGKDKKEACRLFKLSAEQGNDKAQYDLGKMYLEGQGPVKNEIHAFMLFKLSAKQGNPNAQLILQTNCEYRGWIDKNERQKASDHQSVMNFKIKN